MNNERRHNWKENLSKQAQARAAARHDLLVQLDETRRSIQTVGNDYQAYDALKAQQREIAAQLATL